MDVDKNPTTQTPNLMDDDEEKEEKQTQEMMEAPREVVLCAADSEISSAHTCSGPVEVGEADSEHNR